MKINFNMSAVFANDNLRKTENALSTSIEKLSSGYKINHAKDNPSGIAIAKRMNAQIRGLSKASQSASDGVSVIEIAEGALTEVHDMLQRMNELSIKAANGTMSASDRETVQDEINALRDEVTRIAETTEFNGSVLLDGTYDLKGFTETSIKTSTKENVDQATGTPTAGSPSDITFDTSAVTVASYSDEAKIGIYEITVTADVDENGEVSIKNIEITDNQSTTTVHGKSVDLRTVENLVVPAEDDNGRITVTGDDDFSLTLEFDLDKLKTMAGTVNAGTVTTLTGVFNLDLTGIGAMTMQIGANEGQTLDIRIPKVSARSLDIDDLDVTMQDAALESIKKVATAIDTVSAIRSRLGAYQNRLEHSISSLDITEENMTSAYSRIMDVDMAEEMTQYTQQQVLTQAGTSILAQANERPSQILQLLQ